jgi:hypothetical protein
MKWQGLPFQKGKPLTEPRNVPEQQAVQLLQDFL